MGNTVIMKPAPQDPLAVVELARVLEEVGFPPGVINLINSQSPEPASVLTTSPDVDMVSFTGSTAVGQRIAAAGAPTMKRMLMELGGKGAAVVFEDADIKGVVTAIGSTWAFHSGQICTAPTRASGPPEHLRPGGGRPHPVRRRAEGRRPHRGIDRGRARSSRGPSSSGSWTTSRPVARRARWWSGAGVPSTYETGYYVEPTLVVGSNDITVAREEIFGPVVVAIPFDDEEEGIAIANDSEFGLYDYVFSVRHPSGLPGGQATAGRARRHQHRPAQHGRPLRRVQDERHRRDGGDTGLEAYSEMQSIIWSS
jgi:phenylacetaldehyde dehydrogenase